MSSPVNPYAAPQHNAEPNAVEWNYGRIGLACRLVVATVVLYGVWMDQAHLIGRRYHRIDYGFFGYAQFESRFSSGSTFSIHWPNLFASVAVTVLVLCFVYSPLRLIRQLRDQVRQRQRKAAADCGA